jgi:hypothetical protein
MGHFWGSKPFYFYKEKEKMGHFWGFAPFTREAGKKGCFGV